MTAQEVIELLVPNKDDWDITTATLVDAGWVVETKTKTGRNTNAEGQLVNGTRIYFRHPGRGVFDYWGGEKWKAGPPLPCTTDEITSETWSITCTEPATLTYKLDGVTWSAP
jgi:hypothetical protein